MMGNIPKIQALVGCQNGDCAEEISYPLDMVRVFDGAPICEDCFIEGNYGETDEDGNNLIEWRDLLPVIVDHLY